MVFEFAARRRERRYDLEVGEELVGVGVLASVPRYAYYVRSGFRLINYRFFGRRTN